MVDDFALMPITQAPEIARCGAPISRKETTEDHITYVEVLHALLDR